MNTNFFDSSDNFQVGNYDQLLILFSRIMRFHQERINCNGECYELMFMRTSYTLQSPYLVVHAKCHMSSVGVASAIDLIFNAVSLEWITVKEEPRLRTEGGNNLFQYFIFELTTSA